MKRKGNSMDFSQYLNPNKQGLFDFKNKKANVDIMTKYMLSRTQRIFRYEGLPETIPAYNLELYLQTCGYSCIAQFNGNLYAFYGGLGGKPNEYYLPTECIVNNPALGLNKNFIIDKDCVIIKNDSMYIGLLPLINRYLTLLAENELSIQKALINTRIISIISATDDRTFQSARKYISDIERGEDGVILDRSIFDDTALAVNPASQSGLRNITELIEAEQYIKASLFNELGLDNNYNMKREAIMAKESEMNRTILLPLIDDMLYNREQALEKINAMFGTAISVTLDSAWAETQEEFTEDNPEENPEEKKEENTDDNSETN